MITPIPAASRGNVSEMLWGYVAPCLLAFAAGIACADIGADDRHAEVVSSLVAEVHEARNRAAWAQTLAARYARACGRAMPLPAEPATAPDADRQALRAPRVAGPLPVTCRATGAGQ